LFQGAARNRNIRNHFPACAASSGNLAAASFLRPDGRAITAIILEEGTMLKLRHFSFQAALATAGALINTVHTRASYWPAIWNNSRDLLVIAALDGEYLSVNPAWTEVLGWSEGDLLGKSSEWLQHPDDRERTRAELDYLARSHKTLLFENRLRDKEGSYHWISWKAVPDNQHVYAMGRDITERKRAHEARRQLESNLAHVNRVSKMGELAVSLAHEIAQPIASARNNARSAENFLDMQLPDMAEVREALACVIDDLDRAGDIIDRIRDQIKRAPGRNDCFDLNDAINEIIALAQGAAAKNSVSIVAALTEGLPAVQGDRVQLQQVVLNLMLNAVEAMGSVEMGTRELSITTERDETGVLVAVHDSGPGIDPEHLERVFEAFYTTKSGGIGMGLSICRSIIHAHGGRLWAEANEPRGAVFRFTLPGPAGELRDSPQSFQPARGARPALFRAVLPEKPAGARLLTVEYVDKLERQTPPSAKPAARMTPRGVVRQLTRAQGKLQNRSGF
jgi:PAS domain S-box-containing protein